MKHYNYAQLNSGIVPRGNDQKSNLKRYDLTYNGQTLVSNCAFPVCQARKSKLMREQPKNYQPKLFKIELHL